VVTRIRSSDIVRSRLGDLADAVPHLVWVAGPDGVVRDYNGRIADYATARAPGDAAWRWELLVHPEDLEATATAWSASVAAGSAYEHEHRLRMADGSYRWHLSRGIAVVDEATGEVTWYGTATDIDTGRRAEDLLRRTQSSLALAMRGGRMGWWTRDLQTEVVTWSPELENLFGLRPGGFEGLETAFLDRVVPDDRAAVSAAVADAIANRTDYVVEFRFRHADGTVRWMDGRGRATYDDEGRPSVLYGIGIDITGRKETEEAIRAREERLRLAAEAGEFGLYDYDLVSGGQYWSPELLRILGADEVVSPEDAAIHPDDRDETLARFAAAQEPTSDGSFDHVYRMVRPDGDVRWVSTHGRTYFDAPDPSADRAPVRSIGIVMDVTDQRRADELRDVFVGMLSHELRTPVTAIYGGSQVLRREGVDEATRAEIIADIISESERLERLVENLLVLARAERHVDLGGRDPVLLRPILSRIVADKRRRWPGSRIEFEVQSGLPPVLGDEASVELVLRNLISNALKYGAPDGLIRVVARRGHDAVAIRVEDEGPGIDVEPPDRLFDLFYRTDAARRRAQGAGIGLFVVRALVESVGGRVWATNRAEGGAEFGFELPAYDDSDESDDLVDRD
jgi:PAS domain S-box-containing protein